MLPDTPLTPLATLDAHVNRYISMESILGRIGLFNGGWLRSGTTLMHSTSGYISMSMPMNGLAQMSTVMSSWWNQSLIGNRHDRRRCPRPDETVFLVDIIWCSHHHLMELEHSCSLHHHALWRTFAAVICNKCIIIIYLEEANGRIRWSNQVHRPKGCPCGSRCFFFLLLFGWFIISHSFNP